MKFHILQERKVQKEDELAQLAKDLRFNIPTTICSGIYCIYNTATGKAYFGQSVNVLARLNSHKNMLNKGTHDNKKLQKAYNKHGYSFVAFLAQEVSREHLNEAESYYINYFKTHKNGYNKKNKLR